MRKLLLIVVIALSAVLGTTKPAPADPEGPYCLICDLEERCYVRITWNCLEPEGVPECSIAQYQQCLGW
jgi:hypothetical protein